jgi:hypothetical protein
MAEIQERYLESTCPLCGFKNSSYLRIDTPRIQLVTCDNERGGCDEQYGVHVSVVIAVHEWKLVRDGGK